jgi:hypothetical protein
MHFLTSLIIVFGFAFVVCLGLVKMICDLSQVSVHEPPSIPETPGYRASAEQAPAKAADPFKLSPVELSDTQ